MILVKGLFVLIVSEFLVFFVKPTWDPPIMYERFKTTPEERKMDYMNPYNEYLLLIIERDLLLQEAAKLKEYQDNIITMIRELNEEIYVCKYILDFEETPDDTYIDMIYVIGMMEQENTKMYVEILNWSNLLHDVKYKHNLTLDKIEAVNDHLYQLQEIINDETKKDVIKDKEINTTNEAYLNQFEGNPYWDFVVKS